MKITPSIKGQLTKAIKAVGTQGIEHFASGKYTGTRETLPIINQMLFTNVRAVFLRHMPRQQAKHATRKYIASMANG